VLTDSEVTLQTEVVACSAKTSLTASSSSESAAASATEAGHDDDMFREDVVVD
jgi:hypothetical protein